MLSVSTSLAQSNSGNQIKGFRTQPQQKSPIRVPDQKIKMQNENKYKQFMKIQDENEDEPTSIPKKHRNQHLPKIKTHESDSQNRLEVDKRGTLPIPASQLKLEIPKAERNKSTSLKIGGVQQLIGTQPYNKEETLTPLKKNNLKTIGAIIGGGGTPVGGVNDIQQFSDVGIPHPNEESIYKMMNEPNIEKIKQPTDILKKQKLGLSNTTTPSKKPPYGINSKAEISVSTEGIKSNNEQEKPHAWGQYAGPVNEEEFLLVNKKQIGQRVNRKTSFRGIQGQMAYSSRQNKNSEEEKTLQNVRNSHSQFSRQIPNQIAPTQASQFMRPVNSRFSKRSFGGNNQGLDSDGGQNLNSQNGNNDSLNSMNKPGSASKQVRIRSGRPVIKPRKESAISTTTISRKGKLIILNNADYEEGSNEYEQSKDTHHNNAYDNLDSLDKSQISDQFPKNMQYKIAPNSAVDVNPNNQLREDIEEEVPKRQQTFDIRHYQNVLNEIIEEDKKETSTRPSPDNTYKATEVTVIKQQPQHPFDKVIPNITLTLTPSAQTISKTPSNEILNSLNYPVAAPPPSSIRPPGLQGQQQVQNLPSMSGDQAERQVSDIPTELDHTYRMSSYGSVAEEIQRVASNNSDGTTQFWASGKSELLRKFDSPAQAYIRQQQKQEQNRRQDHYGTGTQVLKTLSGNESFYDSIKESLVDTEFTLRMEQTNVQNQQSNSNSGGDKEATYKKSSSSGESHKSAGKQPTQQRMSQSSVGKSSNSSNSVLQASPDQLRQNIVGGIGNIGNHQNFGLQQQFQNPQQIKQFIAQNQEAILAHFSPQRSQANSMSNRITQITASMQESVQTVKVPQPEIPQIQGKLIQWRQGPMIGKGQYGDVYLAMDVDTQRQFAVKKMNLFTPNNSYDQESIKQLKSEIDILKTINDSRIVKYIGSEIINDQFCIYLEYMPGGSIQKIYRDFSGHLEEREIKKYAKQVVEALCFLHERKIAHLDLKGANILLDIEGQVKLSDFGCAAKIQGSLSQSEITGAIKGSIPWMAPEVIKHGKYRIEADIWSLGCTIIEMSVGGNPWGKEAFMNHFQAIVKIAESSDIPEIPSHLSLECKDFIMKCLQKDFRERAKAKELLQHQFLEKEIEGNEDDAPNIVVADTGRIKLETSIFGKKGNEVDTLNSPPFQREECDAEDEQSGINNLQESYVQNRPSLADMKRNSPRGALQNQFKRVVLKEEEEGKIPIHQKQLSDPYENGKFMQIQQKPQDYYEGQDNQNSAIFCAGAMEADNDLLIISTSTANDVKDPPKTYKPSFGNPVVLAEAQVVQKAKFSTPQNKAIKVQPNYPGRANAVLGIANQNLPPLAPKSSGKKGHTSNAPSMGQKYNQVSSNTNPHYFFAGGSGDISGLISENFMEVPSFFLERKTHSFIGAQGQGNQNKSQFQQHSFVHQESVSEILNVFSISMKPNLKQIDLSRLGSDQQQEDSQILGQYWKDPNDIYQSAKNARQRGNIVKQLIEESPSGSKIILPDRDMEIDNLFITKPIMLQGQAGTKMIVTAGPILISHQNHAEVNSCGEISEVDFEFQRSVDPQLSKRHPNQSHIDEETIKSSQSIPMIIIENNTYMEFRDCNFSSTIYSKAMKEEELREFADVEDIAFWCNASILSRGGSIIQQAGNTNYNSVLSLKSCNISEFRGANIKLTSPKILKIQGTIIDKSFKNGIEIEMIKEDPLGGQQQRKLYFEENRINYNGGTGVKIEGIDPANKDQKLKGYASTNLFIKFFRNRLYTNSKYAMCFKNISMQQLDINTNDFYQNEAGCINVQNVYSYSEDSQESFAIISKNRFTESLYGIQLLGVGNMSLLENDFLQNNSSGLIIGEFKKPNGEIVNNAERTMRVMMMQGISTKDQLYTIYVNKCKFKTNKHHGILIKDIVRRRVEITNSRCNENSENGLQADQTPDKKGPDIHGPVGLKREKLQSLICLTNVELLGNKNGIETHYAQISIRNAMIMGNKEYSIYIAEEISKILLKFHDQRQRRQFKGKMGGFWGEHTGLSESEGEKMYNNIFGKQKETRGSCFACMRPSNSNKSETGSIGDIKSSEIIYLKK